MTEPEFPESIDPGEEQILFEKLSMDNEDYDELEAIRRQMRHIYREEHKKDKNGN